MGLRDRLGRSESRWDQFEESRTDRIRSKLQGDPWKEDGAVRKVAKKGAEAAKETLDNVDRKRVVEALRKVGDGPKRPSRRTTAEEREVFARAEDAAAAGPVVDATFDPLTAPEETGFFAMGSGDGANVQPDGTVDRDAQPRVDDLVFGAGVPGQDSSNMGEVGVDVGERAKEEDGDGMLEFDDPFNLGGGF